MLEELHDGHLDVVKMKALARSYIWWPNISGRLEELAKGCDGCQLNHRMPTKAPLPRGSGPLPHGNDYTSTMPVRSRTQCF